MSENQRFVFAKNLNQYMRSTGKTQSDIVTALGFSSSTVSDWVSGKKYPRVDAMQALADYLGVLISDLTMDSSDLSDKVCSALGSDSPAAHKLRGISGQMGIITECAAEKELVSIYRDLNFKGQDMLLNMARSIAANPDMKKDGESSAEII